MYNGHSKLPFNNVVSLLQKLERLQQANPRAHPAADADDAV